MKRFKKALKKALSEKLLLKVILFCAMAIAGYHFLRSEAISEKTCHCGCMKAL